MKPIHILPVNDIKPHSEDPHCTCNPEQLEDNGVSIIVHNSFDGREFLEGIQAAFTYIMPMGIHDGELGNITAPLGFILGYEFCQILHLMNAGRPFRAQFHSENTNRVRIVLKFYSAEYTLYNHDDWPTLVVADCGRPQIPTEQHEDQ